MATWVTHLRVADMLFELLGIQDEALFFSGCIAPDWDEDADRSHWCAGGDKTTCDTDGFFRQHIEGRPGGVDVDFYIGYWVHLLTDVLWHEQKIGPIEDLDRDTVKGLKTAWKNADRTFLSENADFRPVVALKRAGMLCPDSSGGAEICHDPEVEKEISRFVSECAAFIRTQL